MKTFCCLLSLLMMQATLQAQEMRGKITANNGEPIPAAIVYIDAIQTSTSANEEGEYRIKVPAGSYSVLFKSMGYKSVTRKVDVPKQGVDLSMEMTPEALELTEVVVTGNKVDPAIGIMRKVIAKAPYHLREAKHYESTVYLKGTIYVDKIPFLLTKLIEKSNSESTKIKSGNVYVEESVVDITFNAPKYYKKKVRSLRTNYPGANQNPSNPIMSIMASFYAPEIMEFISPLSPQAFQHYNFSYEGCFREGDFLVDKIKVTPRRESQDLMEGTLYIVEDKWCLHSVDLVNTAFWGTLHIKEMFSPLKEGVWLPVSYTTDVLAKMMGVKIRYHYTSSVRYRNVKIDEPLKRAVEAPPTVKMSPVKGKTPVAQVLSQNEISRAEMRRMTKEIKEQQIRNAPDTITPEMAKELTKTEIDSLANKRDAEYWNEFRLVPLTTEEIKSYEEGPVSVLQKVRKDSLQMSRDSTSTKKKKKKNALWPVFGKRFYWNDKKISLNYPGVIQTEYLSFNTVDGIRYGLGMSLLVKTDSAKYFSFQPWVGYGASRQQWMWKLTSSIPYGTRQKVFGSVTLSAGNVDLDFNRGSGIPVFENSVYSLLLRKNYMKLYQDRYVSISNSTRFSKNISWSTSLKYERIQELENHSNFSLYRKNTSYTPNIPDNSRYVGLNGQTYRSAVLSTGITFTPTASTSQFSNRRNSVPSVTLSYETGMAGLLQSTSDYHKISTSIEQQWQLPRKRDLQYLVGGSYWISHKNVFFSSFDALRTSALMVSKQSFRYTFQLLPFYEYNTNQWLIKAHIHYGTNLLLLKRLPLISNRIWNENLYLNYLYTPQLRHYVETGYSLGQIMGFGEIGVFTSFQNFQYRSVGLRIRLGL